MTSLCFAFRQLARSPGFTVVAVASLALGLGVGTAVFSLANAILLRSLPVPEPQQLRVLQWTGVDVRMTSISESPVVSGNRSTAHAVTYPAFLHLRQASAQLADVFGFQPLRDVVVRLGEESFTANGVMVSDNFFTGLRSQPILGRGLTASDFAGGAPNAVIAFDWWENHFGSDSHILGQTVKLNGNLFTIVGVMPRGFDGILAGNPSGFYVPMVPGSPFLYRPITETFHWFVRLMARSRPGVSDAQLQSALESVFRQDGGAIMQEPKIVIEPGHGGLSIDRAQYRRPLMLMMGIVGLVMLAACANLAGLSLSRGAAREHELAVRAALGAGRWRLIRQSLVESLVLAVLGCMGGILLATWIRSALSQLLAGSADGLHYDLSLDLTVVSFSVAMALATAVLSGLLPALRAGRVDPLDGLKARGSVTAPRLRIGRILVTGQIVLSLVLLAVAGLYVRTFINLTRINAGFRTDNLLLFQLNPGGVGYDGAKRSDFYARTQDALAALPGVQGAALLHSPLLANRKDEGGFNFTDRPNSPENSTFRLTVSETFFSTLGIAISQGRALSASDTNSAPKVIVVNEAFVKQCLPNENPLGRTLHMWDADWQIVGVCQNIRYDNIKAPAPPTTYFPFRQRFYSRFATTHLNDATFAVRTNLPPATLLPTIRRLVAGIDPGIPVAHVTTQVALRDQNVGEERLLAALCAALALLALFLSCLGLYGLMAYSVARRTKELAIRMAIGAQPHDVAYPILREAFLLCAAGIGIGIPAVYATTRLIQSQLYGVQANDATTVAATVGLLLLVTLLAAWLPARRAAHVDPLMALRAE